MTTLSARQIGRAAYTAGFRGDSLVTAIAVAIGESSGRVEVVNSIGCVGLWQINQPVHVSAHPTWTRAWLQNAVNNARAAYSLSGGGRTWGPWVVYTNGSYRRFLAAARDGATYAASAGGTPSSGSGSSTPTGPSRDVLSDVRPSGGSGGGTKAPQLKVPKTEADPDPRVRLGKVWFHGSRLQGDLAEAVTDASFSWATDAITQLSLTITDPGFEIFRTGLLTKGVAVLYREPKDGVYPGFDISLRVVSVQLDGGAAGTGGLRVVARSEGVWKLKKRRGPKVMKKSSPTDFVESECKAAGLKVVAQPSTKRGQVARDVAGKGQEETGGADKASSWTTFQRLARELGYLCFEFADTVYFGKPTWLIGQDKTPLQVALPLVGAPEAWVARSFPTISDSEDAKNAVNISGIEVERNRFAECRPGGGVQLRGLPPYDEVYLTTSVEMPLLGTDGITVACATPKNPKPQPPPKPKAQGAPAGSYDDNGDGGSSDSGGATQSGGKSAATFVSIAASASNAAYVFGGEASSSDPTPSALDCSELIEWALGRMGISFPDGSSNQNAAMRQIGVSAAMRTRGALLYKSGHIGISMGDGRSVEARNPSAGVGIFRAADIAWTNGGLVPGLAYG